MRITNWNAKEIFKGFIEKAEANANIVMDEVVVGAKQRLLGNIKQLPPIVRQGGFSSAKVSFVPKTGRDKGLRVQFSTDKRWTGRRTNSRDQLYESIRRVNKPGSGTVRGYVGNALAYWAFMVEKTGYHDRGGKFHPPMHFLQGSFQAAKGDMLNKIAKG